jgi:hypothetical protein
MNEHGSSRRYIRFPLSRGNLLEITLQRRCTRKEYDVIRELLMLAEPAFVDEAEDEARASEAENTAADVMAE